MKNFQCSCCNSLVFFEDKVCVQCQHALGFDPQSLAVWAVQPVEAEALPQSAGETGGVVDAAAQALRWQVVGGASGGTVPAGLFRFCRNGIDYGSCHFLVAADDGDGFCASCRQTRVIPNLSVQGNLAAWTTIEDAKRRLFYTLAKLGLEAGVRGDVGVQTPVYEFMEDVPGEDPVMTGHASGLITINVAEADDAERVRRREDLHEPYRTLTGHFRHEVGHYYWDQFFLNDAQALEECRQVFGDERLDYGEALQQHYQNPKPDWQSAYISSYATAHPWEDWAETWAHYLHLMDLLETAASHQLAFATHGAQGVSAIQCQDPYEVMLQAEQADAGQQDQDITALLNQGMGVSLLLNNLNRSLGQDDAYPFALATPVLHKLGFIHNIVRRKTRGYQVERV